MTFPTSFEKPAATVQPVKWRAQLPDVIDLSNPPVGAFDAFADLISGESDLPYAMVNIFGSLPGKQLFVGLSNPTTIDLPQAERTMPAATHGWCPEVVDRRGSLVLHDTLAYAQFSTNPVIDEFGIRTYMGAPLLDKRAGRVWGTVCAIGPNPRHRATARSSRLLIEYHRDLLMDAIFERTRLH
ncbi:GAF domain-containing protein [Streptomyces mirabilis]|uniref:GAF domain-containing protein n=1 Tax=Streptomyces mirabilis TaxID=68239 RepID=UPI003682AD48